MIKANPTQFGFRQNKQTLDSIIKLDLDVKRSIDSRKHLHLISFDIQKAFDKVWPEAVVYKLKQLGIGGKMLEFVKEYLGKRSFVVINGGFKSSYVEVDLGVPQGSPLSSTIFLVVFQMLLDVIPSGIQFSAYADDLLIYLSDKDNKKIRNELQHTVDILVSTADSIGLKFSTTKTKTIHICNMVNSRSKKGLRCGSINLQMYKQPIEEKSDIKLLGLHIQKNYTWNKHVNVLKERITKDLNLLKMLSHNKYAMNQDTMRRVITALVVSKIRYCVEIYGTTGESIYNKIDVLLNHFKRLMLRSFCSTPRETLNIQSGIPNFVMIRFKSITSNCSELNEDIYRIKTFHELEDTRY